MEQPYPANHESGVRESRKSLVDAMMEPGFYPKPCAEVTHQETHISHVFFAGDFVYKVKKAVHFSFLDFSTLALRRHYLQQELLLNRRLAPSVYLAVMPIGFELGAWRLGGWSEPREYALVMRRLPAKRMLRFLLQTNQVTPAMTAELADLLAQFHSAAETIHSIDPAAYVAALDGQWRENISDLMPLLGNLTDQNALEIIDDFGQRFLTTQRDLLARRIGEGWIRDVHGDLHSEHICFAPEGIQIFDCIEFNTELRRCDLASEIAFLLMDVEVNGGANLLEPFIAQYTSRIKDAALSELLPFFECYRALVRAKVHSMRAHSWNDETEMYFRFAARVAWKAFQPFIVMLCGLTGTGKSTLAREMAQRLGLSVINSDVVRKRIAGKIGRHLVSFDHGIYGPAMTEKTYARMSREAEAQVADGKGVILDATFLRRAHRETIIKLAAKQKTPLFIIHCAAPDGTTRERLGRRAAQQQDISDGRWEIYVQQKAAFEPIDELPAALLLEVNTELPIARLSQLCEHFLLAHLREIAKSPSRIIQITKL